MVIDSDNRNAMQDGFLGGEVNKMPQTNNKH